MDTLLASLYRRWQVRSLSAKLLVPGLGLVLLSLLGSVLAFVGGTAFTRNQLLEQQITDEAEHVGEGLEARVGIVATAATLLAGDPNVIGAVQMDTEAALGLLNERIVVVRDRFDLDLVQVYDQQGQERANLVLSSLYRESSLLDQVEANGPIVKVVNDRLLVLNRVAMPGGAGTVIAGVDLETELHRLESKYHLPSALGLSAGDVHIGTRTDLPLDSPDGQGGGQYKRSVPLLLGDIPVDLMLVRPVADITHVMATGLTVMIGSNLLATLLLIGLGAGLIRSMAKPIQHLAGAAEAVARGDLGQQVELSRLASPFAIGSDDEIGLLAAAFNGMVADLRSLYDNLEAKVEARTQELTTTAEVARTVCSSLDMDVVLRIAVQLIRERLGFYFVGIFTVDPGSEVAALRWATGEAGQALLAQGFQLAVGSGSLVGSAVTTRRPFFVQDVRSEPMFLSIPQLLDTGSSAAVPLLVKQQVVGVLYVQNLMRNVFVPELENLLITLADQIAIGVQNARLYAQEREHAEQLEVRVQERTAQLQAQYARLEAVLDSASEGIIVADARGEIIQANPVAQIWLAKTLSPEDAARLEDAVRDLACRADDRPKEVLELTGLDLELKAAPISESGLGEAVSVVAVHDVSHLKALDRMKSRFVSNVSHELRTPVTTIKLYAALLQRTSPENSKWGEYLNAMAKEADRQARLVEDILQISRIDTGRLEMEPRTVSLNELSRTAVESHRVLALNRGVTLKHRPMEPGPATLVDPERMMQVLNNLVENAIYYSPEGGEVVVSTGEVESEGRVWATTTVTDKGMGIPEEELPQIFVRFFRGEQPRLMQISGTGLGLAIVKEIVDLHGGRVIVESQVGRGSSFIIWLPFIHQDSPWVLRSAGFSQSVEAEVEEASKDGQGVWAMDGKPRPRVPHRV